MESYASVAKRCCANPKPWTVCPKRPLTDLDELKKRGSFGDTGYLSEINKRKLLESMSLEHVEEVVAYVESKKMEAFGLIGEQDKATEEDLFHFGRIKGMEEFILEFRQLTKKGDF